MEPACRHRATGPSPGISTSAVTTGHRIDCPRSQARSRVPRLASICDILSLRFHELHDRGPVAGLPAAASRLYDPKREINNPNVPSRPLPKRHDDSGLYQAACHLRRVLNARLWPLRRGASDRRGSGGSGRPRARKLGGYAGSAGEKRPALQPADQWRESLFWAPIAELRRKRSGHPGLASSHQCSADRYRSLSTQMPSSLRTEAGQDSSARSRIVRSPVADREQGSVLSSGLFQDFRPVLESPYQSCRPSLPEGLRRAVSAVIPKVRAFRQGGNEDVMPLANSGIRAHGTVRRTQNIQSGHCAFQSVRFAEEEFAFSARVPSHVISLFVRAARAGGRPRGPRGLHAGPKAGEDVNRHNVAEQYIHSDPNREGGKGLPSYWFEFSESRGQPDAEEAEDERPRA